MLIFSQVSDFFLPLGPANKNNVKTTTKISFPMKFAPLLRVEYVHSKKGKFKKTYVPGKPCDEYSTKTFTGLAAKIKCKRNQ